MERNSHHQQHDPQNVITALDNRHNPSQQSAGCIQLLEWYHPTASRHVAESLLMLNGQDGSYLLRPSHQAGTYSLSVRGQDSVKHYPLTSDESSFCLGLTTFNTFNDLLRHFNNQPLLGAESGIVTVLKYPYPRTVDEPSHYDCIRVHAQLGPRLTSTEVPLTMASKEGFLTKRGGIIKNWKLRWFVLKKNELRYCRQRTDEAPLRVLDLAECTECVVDTCDGRLNCFRLVFPWRVFYLSATSAAEAKDWIELIQWKLVGLRASEIIRSETARRANYSIPAADVIITSSSSTKQCRCSALTVNSVVIVVNL